MLTKKDITAKYFDKYTQEMIDRPAFQIGGFLDI